MKSFNLSKLVGAGVLVASLATLPLVPASAQDGITDSSKAAPGDTAVYENGEIDKSERTFDWGWVGLLGLLGLAGRLAKHHQEPVLYTHNQTHPLKTTEESVRFRDPEEINRPVITEESLRYKDPQEMNHPSTDGSNRR